MCRERGIEKKDKRRKDAQKGKAGGGREVKERGRRRTQLFGWRIQRLASSLQGEPSLDARLLFWSFLNELLLFTYVDQKVDTRPRKEYWSDDEADSHPASSRLLRREHFTSDTVFDRELDEVMAAVRQLATAGRLAVDGLKELLLTDLFFQVLIAVSEELRVLLLLLWRKKESCTTALTTGSDVQWDIVHEALRLLHNARQLEIIPDSLGDFFQELQRRSRCSLAFPDALSTRLLMELFEQAPPLANPLTNGHLSMTALLQLALVDELYDDEKCEVVFHFEQDHLALARQLHRLARNACLSSVGLRQVAAICLTTSLPMWARIASSVNEKEYREYPKLFLDDHCSPSIAVLPQMLCTLFSALFELLADWDGGVVKRAEELVRSLAEEHLHLGAEKLENREISNGKLLDSFSAAAATRLAVAIFAELHRRISGQPLASFALLRLTVELFLEDVQEDGELPEEEESSPFEKSKLNGPSHFDLLAEMLLQELATLKAVIQSASVCEPQVETVLLSDTVQAALGETEMVPEALLADLIKDIRYIETKAKEVEEKEEQSSPNRFEHIITKLKRAFIC